LAFRALHGRQTSALYGLGPLTESQDHLVGIKGFAHERMLEELEVRLKLVTWLLGPVLLNRGRRQLWPATSEELT
jgi:hypothetical protein